jgi:hypothetical protein
LCHGRQPRLLADLRRLVAQHDGSYPEEPHDNSQPENASQLAQSRDHRGEAGKGSRVDVRADFLIKNPPTDQCAGQCCSPDGICPEWYASIVKFPLFEI